MVQKVMDKTQKVYCEAFQDFLIKSVRQFRSKTGRVPYEEVAAYDFFNNEIYHSQIRVRHFKSDGVFKYTGGVASLEFILNRNHNAFSGLRRKYIKCHWLIESNKEAAPGSHYYQKNVSEGESLFELNDKAEKCTVCTPINGILIFPKENKLAIPTRPYQLTDGFAWIVIKEAWDNELSKIIEEEKAVQKQEREIALQEFKKQRKKDEQRRIDLKAKEVKARRESVERNHREQQEKLENEKRLQQEMQLKQLKKQLFECNTPLVSIKEKVIFLNRQITEKRALTQEKQRNINELKKGNRLSVSALPLEDNIKALLKLLGDGKIKSAVVDSAVSLYNNTSKVVELIYKTTLDQMMAIESDVDRINNIEKTLDKYTAKIKRVREDDDLDDEERETKIMFWQDLRDRDIQELEG